MDAEQLKQLEQDLKNAKAEYVKAKKVLDNIQSLEIRYQKAAELIDSVKTTIESRQVEIDKNAQSIKVTNDEIKNVRTEISTYLESADNNIKELQTLVTRAAELKGIIEGRDGEIEALLKSARVYSADIEKLKVSAQENLDKSDVLMKNFQTKVAEMQKAHDEFLLIQAKIEDKNTGLKAALEYVQKTKTQSEQTLTEIQSLKATASEEVVQIEKFRKQTEADAQKVGETLEYANERKSQVEKVSGLVIDGSFAETFERRKREIDKGLNDNWFSWRNILLGSVVLLIAAVLLPFSTLTSDWFSFGELKGWEGFFTRAFYTFPLIFLAFFSAAQYSKERQFLERYAFKAASAAAVRNHIEFLRERFPSDKSIAKFAINVFNSIYSEPFKIDKEKVEKNQTNIFKNFKGNSKEKVDLLKSVESLYEIVPDEAAVKQIIEVITDLKKPSQLNFLVKKF